MQTSVNGRAVAALSKDDWSAVRLARAEPSVAAAVMASDAALRRYRVRSLWRSAGFTVATVVLAFFCLGIALDGNADARTPMIVIVLLGLALGLAWIAYTYRRRIRRFHEKLGKPGALAADPGTELRADDAGFTLGGKSWPWSELSLDAVDLILHDTSTSTQNSRYYRVEQITIAAPDRTLVLEVNALTNGRALVDNAYRRLIAATQ